MYAYREAGGGSPEYPAAKNLKVARSQSIFGPWKIAEKPFTPVGTWVELKQKEADDLSALAGVENKPVKHLDGVEKEKFDRQARKQKVRQKTTFKKRF